MDSDFKAGGENRGRDLADQGLHLGAHLLQLWQVHLTTNLHPGPLLCSWNQAATLRWDLSAVFRLSGTSAAARPVAVTMVGCATFAIDGIIVVVPTGGRGRVVAANPCGSLSGLRVLGGDGGGEQDRLQHPPLLSPVVLAMLHVFRLAFLVVPLAHLLNP